MLRVQHKINVHLLIFYSLVGVLVILALTRNHQAFGGSVSIASGGLGLTRAQWDQHHTLDRFDGQSTYYYDCWSREGCLEWIRLWQEPGQNSDDATVQSINVAGRLFFSDTVNVSLNMWRGAARSLLPNDATLQSTRPSTRKALGIGILEIYHSDTLEQVYRPLSFAASPWSRDLPGTISVEYVGEGILIEAGTPWYALQPTSESKPAPTKAQVQVPTESPGELPSPIPTVPGGIGTIIPPIPSGIPKPIPTGPIGTVQPR